jgi:hypothetical protein
LNCEDGGSKKRPIFIIERAVHEDLPGIGDPLRPPRLH